uniref:Nanos C2HC-type zinc finger 3 n=1 Tax=Varanus komodoensis TaxID=61221 RepID=A0A8D2Q4A3_VARKO
SFLPPLWKDYFQLAKVVEEMCREEDVPKGPASLQQQAAPLLYKPSREVFGPRKGMFCRFCRHNGEAWYIYMSHRLKDEAGRVQCPILRSYTCPQCGASADWAHTIRFCPLTRKGYTSVYNTRTRNAASKKVRHRKLRQGLG